MIACIKSELGRDGKNAHLLGDENVHEMACVLYLPILFLNHCYLTCLLKRQYVHNGGRTVIRREGQGHGQAIVKN